MRAAMVRIGFSDQAAQALVEEQGITTLDEIRLLSDEEIELWIRAAMACNLCLVCDAISVAATDTIAPTGTAAFTTSPPASSKNDE